MKKTTSIILALMIFVSVFSGCGAKENNELVFGNISENVYTNSFAGLSFTLPDGWTYATEAELEELMGEGSEAIYGDDQQAAMEYAMSATIYDMMAQNTDDGSNIIAMLENTAMYEGGTEISEEEYLAALKSSLELSTSVTYIISDTVTKATINDVEYTVLESEIEGYGGAYQTYYVRRIGKYMLCICFTGYEANPGSVMQGYFK